MASSDANQPAPQTRTSVHARRRTVALSVLLAACAAGAAGCGRSGGMTADGPQIERPAPGIEVVRRWPPGRSSLSDDDVPVTLVHVDPALYELRLLTADRYGPARSVERWSSEFGLWGAINASMYLPNLHSTGLMIDDDRVNNPAMNPRFEGVLAFDPRDPDDEPVLFAGTDCPGFDIEDIRARYRFVVQNYRLLDCDGEPIDWADRKLYATAAIGRDRRGRVVFVHSGAPSRTQDVARWLARPEWGLVAAHFVEGGADASLFLQVGEERVAAVGGFEGGRGGRAFRPIPNVIGFVPRAAE